MKNLFYTLLILTSLNLYVFSSTNLGETDEIKFTQDLIKLSESLDNDPVQLYNYVYDNISYIDYRGSTKTAQSVFETKVGNQVDQCTLLIALYRIAGIQAVYKYKSLASDYCFVYAKVPMDSIRGWSFNGSSQWIALSPWFKAKFPQQEALTLLDGSDPMNLVFNSDDYLLNNNGEDVIDKYYEVIKDYLVSHSKGYSIGDIFPKSRLINMTKDILPNSSIIDRSSNYDNYTELDESFKSSFEIQIEVDGVIQLSRKIYYYEMADKQIFVKLISGSNREVRIYKGQDDYESVTISNTGTIEVKCLDYMENIVYDKSQGLTFSKPLCTIGSLKSTYSYDSIKNKMDLFSNESLSMVDIQQLMVMIYSYSASKSISDINDLYNFKKWFEFSSNTGLTPSGFVFIYGPETTTVKENKIGAIIKATTDVKISQDYTLPENSNFEVMYRNLIWYQLSLLEGKIYEDFLGQKGYSTVQLLREAEEENIMIRFYDQSDLVTLSNGVVTLRDIKDVTANKYPQYAIDEMVSKINAGYEIYAPVSTLANGKFGFAVYSDGSPVAMSFLGDNGGETEEEGYVPAFDFQAQPTAENNGAYDDVPEEYNRGVDPDTYGPVNYDGDANNFNPGSTPQPQIPSLGDYSAPPITAPALNNNNYEGSVMNPNQGDPVNVANGEFFVDDHPDFDINLRGGLGLTVTRHYGSQFSYDGPFGHGWISEHHQHLIIDLDDNTNPDIIFVDDRAGAWSIKHIDGSYNVLNSKELVFTKLNSGNYTVTYKSTQVSYEFNLSGKLIRKVSKNGIDQLVYNYDSSSGRLNSVVYGLGRSLLFYYNSTGTISEIKESIENRSVYYSYDAANNLTSIINLNGDERQYEYLSHQLNPYNDHNINRIIDEEGNSLSISYYYNDKASYHRNDLGEEFHFDYSNFNKFTEIRTERGLYRKMFYNEFGDIVKVIDESKNTWERTYNSDRQVISRTDPLGYETTYKYDDNGNIVEEKDEDSSIMKTFTYDLNYNQILYSTDPNGHVSQFTYDNKYYLNKKIMPNGSFYDYDYDSYGQVVKVTDSENQETTYSYNYDNVNSVFADIYLQSSLNSEGETQSYDFDRLGRLEAKTDADGFVTRYEYDELNNLLTTIHPDGSEISKTYTGIRQIESYIDENGNETLYSYHKARDMVSGAKLSAITDPLGYETNFKYDEVGNNIETIDRNSYVSYKSFDLHNRVNSQTSSEGVTHYFSYDANNFLKEKYYFNDFIYNQELVINYSVYDIGYSFHEDESNNGKEKYSYGLNEYDSLSRLVKYTDPLGQVTINEYDDNGNLEYVTDYLGTVTKFKYDSMNRLVKKTLGYNHSTETPRVYETKYDNLSRVVQVIDPMGRVQSFEYNIYNKITVQKWFSNMTNFNSDNYIKKNRYEYNGRGLKTLFEDGNGQSWRYTYNSRGFKTSEEDPDGHFIRFEYDLAGNLTRTTDRVGNSTRYIYNSRNELIKTIDPYGNIKLFKYDGNGNKIKVVDETGKFTLTHFDSQGRVIGKEDGEGNTAHFEYDFRGNLVRETSRDGLKKSYTYDAINRLELSYLRKGDALKEYSYDIEANQLVTTEKVTRQKEVASNEDDSITPPVGDAFIYNRIVNNIFGETSISTLAYNSVDSQETTYEYYKDGKLKYSIDDNGVEILREYNDLGNLKKIYDGDGVSFRFYQYDLNNNLTEETRQDNSIVTKEYDNNNRLTNVYFNGTLEQNLSYDFDGRLIEGTDFNSGFESRTIEYSYDLLGRVLVAEQGDYSVSYDYEDNSRINTITYPSLEIAKYEYDQRNNISNISDDINFEYSKSSKINRAVYGNGVTLNINYSPIAYESDRTYHSSSVKLYGNSSADSSFAYLTENGAPSKITIDSDVLNSQIQKGGELNFDLQSRVTSKSSPNATFSYDKLGNKVSSKLQVGTISYGSANADNELSSFTLNNTTKYITYDNRGNLTNDEDFEYTYDWKNRLSSVSKNGVNVCRFTYDVLDRRVSKNDTIYIYHNKSVIEEYQNLKLTNSYIYGSYVDNPLILKKNGIKFYYITDRNYNVIALVNESGSVVESYFYGIFGETIVYDQSKAEIDESAYGNRHGFQGRLWDSEIELYDYRARVYSPKFGRFMQRDPAGYVDGMNRYAFVKNNPMRWLDPSGLFGVEIDGINFGIGEPNYVATNFSEYASDFGGGAAVMADSMTNLEELGNALGYQVVGALELVGASESASHLRTGLAEISSDAVNRASRDLENTGAGLVATATVASGMTVLSGGAKVLAVSNSTQIIVNSGATSSIVSTGISSMSSIVTGQEVTLSGTAEVAALGFVGGSATAAAPMITGPILSGQPGYVKNLSQAILTGGSVATATVVQNALAGRSLNQDVLVNGGSAALSSLVVSGLGPKVPNMNSIKQANQNFSPHNVNTATGASLQQNIAKDAAIGMGIGIGLSSSNSPACFVAGTKILTRNGLKVIEEVQKGDLILSKNEMSGEIDYRAVVKTFLKGSKSLVNLTYTELYSNESSEKVLTGTYEHPFWEADLGKWVDMSDLIIGSKLLLSNGKHALVLGKDLLESKTTMVYNFEVAEYHTYFVASNNAEVGIWVHNTCQ